MEQKTIPVITWESIINGLLQRLEIPSKEEINMINRRLDNIEKLICQKQSDSEKAGKAGKADKADKNDIASDIILGVFTKHAEGANFKTIKAETEYNDKKIRNIIFRLDKTGKIKRIKRGVYKKI
ncbi:MAG: hypothetical protein U9N77_12810 [Thermodesulfobacteriota bacterium]|nr:hypothetical protein [Thermodesulfobacteriota bacterium]